MMARRLGRFGIVFLLLTGCVVDRKEFETLRDQVRLQQKQIVELKARQEDQVLRIDALNNGFRIISDKTEETSRRIDDFEGRDSGLGTTSRASGEAPAGRSSAVTAEAPAPAPPPAPPRAPTPAPTPAPAPAPAPAPVPASVAAPAPAPMVTPAAPAPQETILLTNRPEPGAPAVPAGGEIITAGPKAEKLYAGALALFSNRRYTEASLSFAEFVVMYPDHKLAGNAQYWIGECYYSQRQFRQAAEEFGKVEKIYPTSPKVPASLLKKGLSLLEMNKMPEAREAFERIIARYPQSEEAAKASDRLARWKQ